MVSRFHVLTDLAWSPTFRELPLQKELRAVPADNIQNPLTLDPTDRCPLSTSVPLLTAAVTIPMHVLCAGSVLNDE